MPEFGPAPPPMREARAERLGLLNILKGFPPAPGTCSLYNRTQFKGILLFIFLKNVPPPKFTIYFQKNIEKEKTDPLNDYKG